MLLDIGSVLGGIGLAVVAFVVVVLVCVVILRLLAAILPSYEARDAARLAESMGSEPEPEDAAIPAVEGSDTGGVEGPDTGGADDAGARTEQEPEP